MAIPNRNWSPPTASSLLPASAKPHCTGRLLRVQGTGPRQEVHLISPGRPGPEGDTQWGAQISEFLGESPAMGRGGQRAFAASEKGSLDPLQLLLTDETARAGGPSRSPCPGLCLSVQESLGHRLPPGGIHFACFTHFHLERKGPFFKTGLENLLSRQIPSSMLKTHLKPSAKSSLSCMPPGMGGSLLQSPHSVGAVLAFGKF